jgi:phosphatidylglycerophosphatase A
MQLKSHAVSCRDRWVLMGTSVLGLGYLPVAPGTWGTLGALPLYWLLSGTSVGIAVAATAALTAAAVALSGRAEAIYGGHDVQHIVIDEVVGLLWAVVAVPWRLPQIVAAFVLFRLLDALKPWPIRVIDRQVGGGLGVVLDDVAAGMVACALLHGARFFWGGWWG